MSSDPTRGFEAVLTGEDGAHAIECDCDFDPVCDDLSHQSPEYHIGTECSIVQETIRAAHQEAVRESREAGVRACSDTAPCGRHDGATFWQAEGCKWCAALREARRELCEAAMKHIRKQAFSPDEWRMGRSPEFILRWFEQRAADKPTRAGERKED